MKIAINNKRVHHYDSLSYKSKLAAREMGAEKAGQNRDRVFIGSDASQSDKLIAGEAAHKVIQEVRRQTPQDKIESLKQQVADGTYHPDAEKIAARILLEKGIV